MTSSNENHQYGMKAYFHSAFIQPVSLGTEEIGIINSFIGRLYTDLGSVIWIKLAFRKALDAYWKTKGAKIEVAKGYEEEISPQMQQMVIARQFSRATAGAVKNYVVDNTVDIVHYWNSYSDPYPPSNIEGMNEPFRRFFLLLKDLVGEMDQRNDPIEATKFLASLMAAFALTYPISYLVTDPYFQRYLENEVVNKPIDDDYTFYLCRDIDYMLFDRF